MLRVLVLGYGPMGLALVDGLLACPDAVELLGVYPWSVHPGGHLAPREASETLFLDALEQLRIPIIRAAGVNHFSFIRVLGELRPDVVLIGSWGEILSPHVLNMPGIRFINCHPSLLPAHRGPNPYIAAILSGDTVTGVTFHQVDTGIDTGPILLQATVPVAPTDTGGSLRARCAAVARDLLPELIRRIQAGSLQVTPQPAKGPYDHVTESLLWIRWTDPPERIERLVRALSPWHAALSRMHGRTLACTQCRLQTEPIQGRPESVIRPGTLLKKTSDHWTVASTNPTIHIQLMHIRITGWAGRLPFSLGQIGMPCGHVFQVPRQFLSD